MNPSFESKNRALATKYVFEFAKNLPTPPLDKTLLGGKGKGLAEMTSIGIPVPPGFIISTEACNDYRHGGRVLPAGLEEQVQEAIKTIGKTMKAEFGSETHPLLVSVRSGARVSMPGMMDTILDLGMNDRSVIGFAKIMQNERLAYDSYRRFIQMYSDIVKGVNRKYFDQAFNVLKMREGVMQDSALSVEGLKETCDLFKKIFYERTRQPFPQDAQKQLFEAIGAVFNSWDSERAILYRQINHIPDDWGTAVIVQSMVFGNKNELSATGVGFTRNPASGENAFYGEFLINAQGEEVVAGIRTPQPINKRQKEVSKSSLLSLEESMPRVYEELHAIVKKLESYFHDMQDIEFTIDNGHLFLLQTRTGKRTGFAAVKMAVEMLDEGLIDEKTALKRIQPEQLMQLLAPIFDPKAKEEAKDKLAAKGLNAGPGAASGRAAFSTEKALEFKKQGIKSILIREDASPDDFPGMVAADGILTLRGGSTSHAAVVARGMGKPCVVGCGGLSLSENSKTISSKTLKLKEGDPISIDGLTGEVFFADLPTSPSEIVQVLVDKTKKPEDSLLYQQYKKIMEMADAVRRLKVRANADTPQDCAIARDFGAEGIGLCRTEHMFMDPERLTDVRRMFFSTNLKEKTQSIQRLLPHQKKDFIGIFREMNGLPVTIRLLDPPLHEFMPHNEMELSTLADQMGISEDTLMSIRSSLEEHNPMLGHRGCRLGVIYPEITEMQTRAILEAALAVRKEGIQVFPEIMVPLVGIEKELLQQKEIIDLTAKKVFSEQGQSIPYSVGTMIELPRACLTADAIAEEAEFFSFGTNDLTQTTFGISRDDSAKFVPLYVKGVPDPLDAHEIMHILPDDPFQVIDREGVGKLMEIAVKLGKQTRRDLKCGICGEHGGDPSSIKFCAELNLDYVSCSPYRVPIARLAAAIAAIEDIKEK